MVGFQKNPYSNKYKILPKGSRIKFLKSSKYDYDFKKGDLGSIERILSPFPKATDTIYQVVCEKSGEKVWVTGTDIESFEQLILETADNWENVRNWRVCDASLFAGTVPCSLAPGHEPPHLSADGLEWTSSTDWKYKSGRSVLCDV